MKNSSKSLSLILAAGVAGVALFRLAQAQFTASIPGDTIVAAGATLALIAMAAADYSRRLPPLTVKAQLLRPSPKVARFSDRKERVAA